MQSGAAGVDGTETKAYVCTYDSDGRLEQVVYSDNTTNCAKECCRWTPPKT